MVRYIILHDILKERLNMKGKNKVEESLIARSFAWKYYLVVVFFFFIVSKLLGTITLVC